MLEIVFLGTGAGIPTKNRNQSSIWLNYTKDISSVMLWDCGEGTQRQIFKAGLNFMKIDNIFITHWHADHWAGIITLILTMNMEKRRKPLHIYAPECERFVSDILDLGYWGPGFRVIPREVPFEGSDITAIMGTKYFDILSVPVRHSVPAVAYCFKEKDSWRVDIKEAEKKYGLKQGPLVGRLKEKGQIELKGRTIRLEDVGIVQRGIKAAYSGDTSYCENLVRLSKDADLLIHDATFLDDEDTKKHSGVDDGARTAKKAGVERLVLTHFSRRYQDLREFEDKAKKLFPNTVIAKDFMRLELKHRQQA